MIANAVPSRAPQSIRLHPYEPGGKDPRVRYYDFRNHPELIPFSLEDFRPWERYEAIPRFYDLLRWLNGAESAFESNDCGFAVRPGFGFALDVPVVAGGRLMFFIRELDDNRSRPKSAILNALLFEAIGEADPEFTRGHIDVSTAFASFTALPGADDDKVGVEFMLEFFAWGESEEEAMSNLSRLFVGLRAALQLASDRWNGMGIGGRGGEVNVTRPHSWPAMNKHPPLRRQIVLIIGALLILAAVIFRWIEHR